MPWDYQWTNNGVTRAQIYLPLTEYYIGYTIRYTTYGGPYASATESGKAGSVKSVRSAPTAPGYTFSGWTSSDVSVSGGSFTMPAKDVAFTGMWTPRTDTAYSVEFYKQSAPLSGNYIKTADSLRGSGTTGTQIRAALNMTALNDKYENYHLTDASKNNTTTIAGDGSSVLKLYYDYEAANVTYSYSGDTDVAPPTLPAETSHIFGETVTLAAAPTLTGYEFSGWTSGDAVISDGSFTMPVTNVTITGAWTPRSDTPYTVEYYLQNLDDNSYTLDDTVSKQGLSGAVIPDALRPYSGFTATETSAAAAVGTKIASNGKTVLKLYYDRNVNAVSYAYSGDTDTAPPALPTATSYRYGQTVTLAVAPTLTGYEFSGWASEDAVISGDSFTMPVTNVTLTGAWTPRSDTPYTVEYYLQNLDDNSYTLDDTVSKQGLSGAVIPDALRPYSGFTATESSAAAAVGTKIASDGKTVLKLYYDRNISTVIYAYSGNTEVTPPVLPTATSYRYGQTVTLAVAPTLTGYDFSGWASEDAVISGDSFTMPDKPVEITGVWSPATDTKFTVEYYQQNVENDDYTLADALHGEGVTGASVPHREFDGFTQTPDSVTAEGNTTIRSDGTTLLKLYYDRDSCSVSFAYSGATPKDAPALPAATSYRYGQTVTLAVAPTLTGYEFSGWASEDAVISGDSFTMPDKPVEITGVWSPATDTKFTVEYYQQNVGNSNYTLAYTHNGKGVTGANIPHKEFEGFTQTPDSVTAEGNTTIKSDGTTLLKLYYDRDSYSVSFAYSGATPKDAPVLPTETSYRYGASVTPPIVPGMLSGMSFSGWSLDGKHLSESALSVPARDMAIIGSWSEIHDSGDSGDSAPQPTPPQPIEVLGDNGSAYIIGYEDGTFRPDDFLTAKHETLMLSRLGFSMVPLGDSTNSRYITRREFLSALLDASGAVTEGVDSMAQAAALGWITGLSTGELLPDAFITRAQAVTIVNRAFGRVDALPGAAAADYTDVPKDHWAYDAIHAASAVL